MRMMKTKSVHDHCHNFCEESEASVEAAKDCSPNKMAQHVHYTTSNRSASCYL